MRLPRGKAAPEPDGYVRKKDRPAEPADESEGVVSDFTEYDTAPPSEQELYAAGKPRGGNLFARLTAPVRGPYRTSR
jgi:hypothetical protein